ncbi:hypothetical protein GOP47_0030653, partial [Adiantum capillus-veneris]
PWCLGAAANHRQDHLKCRRCLFLMRSPLRAGPMASATAASASMAPSWRLSCKHGPCPVLLWPWRLYGTLSTAPDGLGEQPLEQHKASTKSCMASPWAAPLLPM